MNREIKVKAWDKKKKVMYKPISILELAANAKYYWGGSEGLNLDNLELLLWTGLKDRNGKEIYDNDIVEYGREGTNVSHDGVAEDYLDNDKRLIRMVEDIRSFRMSGETPNGGWWRMYKPEVIGNKFENPELLKGDDE